MVTDTATLTWPVVESDEIPVKEAQTHQVMRAFDGLRRKIARTVAGSDGAFLGYDRLWLPGPVNEDTGRVVVAAVLLSTFDRSQAVAYEATYIDERTYTRRTLARGVGITAAVACE